MRLIAALAVLLLPAAASAHPNDPNYWSLRTMLRTSDAGVQVVVGLEIPVGTVLEGIVAEAGGDADSVKARHEKKYTQAQWDALAEGLTVTVNGEPEKGSFAPLEHPINGKAGEQFAVYLVGLQLPKPEKAYGDTFTVVVSNTAFPDAPMFHSVFAKGTAPWAVAENSAREVLGDAVEIEDATEVAEAWKQDDSLRTITVKMERGG